MMWTLLEALGVLATLLGGVALVTYALTPPRGDDQ